MDKSVIARVNRHQHRALLALGASLIVLLTVIVYVPAMRGGFIWDDDRYVTENPLITAPDGMSRIWFSLDSPSQYFPLVYTTFRIEHSLWGFNPLGYHIVNIILHAINALLVWLVLRRLSIRGAWLAAAIFALHPVHVESVAWITERKNVLSTLFYLLTILAWLRYTDKSTARPQAYYWLAFALCALALFSKTTACTLPAVLLLILWLKGKRIGRRQLEDVVPFAILSVLMGLITVWWERYEQGTFGEEFAFSALERVLIASRALWFYVVKLVWPARLTFSYPRWAIDAAEPMQYAWLVGCAVLVAALWWWRRALGREPAAAAAFFAVSLAPMLGFFSLYTFRYAFVADHYQYVASIGPIAFFSAIVMRKWERPTAGYGMRFVFPLVILAVLGMLTWRQAHAYRDMETLWLDTLAKNPSSALAHNNLGIILFARGEHEEAFDHYSKALHLNPRSFEACKNMGDSLAALGKPEQAIDYYNKALELNPDYPYAHYSLANILVDQGRLEKAVVHYSKAIQVKPDYAEARYNLGVALAKQGKKEEAARQIAEAVRINPGLAEGLGAQADSAQEHFNRGVELAVQGKTDEAIQEYREALRIQPDLGEGHYNLAVALYLKGDYAEAWEEVRLSLRYGVTPNPDFLAALSEKMPEPR